MNLYEELVTLGAFGENGRVDYEESDTHIFQKVLEEKSKTNKLVSDAIEKGRFIRHAYTEHFLRSLRFNKSDITSVSVRDDFPSFTNREIYSLYEDLQKIVTVSALDDTSMIDRFALRITFEPLVFANGTALKRIKNGLTAVIGDVLYKQRYEKIDEVLKTYRKEEAKANSVDNLIGKLYDYRRSY
ncbi:MAG: hypothetical protein ACMXX9_02655 [Candidatus Woesearchaeota archaeon]